MKYVAYHRTSTVSYTHLDVYKRQYLFQDISMDIRRGERVALIGDNGAGKTTILKIINGLLPADTCELRLGAKVHIGYYDQEHQVLHDEKTIFKGLCLFVQQA